MSYLFYAIPPHEVWNVKSLVNTKGIQKRKGWGDMKDPKKEMEEKLLK
jgi:hypothetical protein